MSVKQDVIANNLANASTVGFRKEGLIISSFTEIMDREVSGMEQASSETMSGHQMQTSTDIRHRSATHMSQGALKETGSSFDLALSDDGNGMFTIKTARGIEFTRSGKFRLNNEGFLVTPDGSQVMGHNGAIRATGNDFKVTDDGTVMVDGKSVDRILVSVFESTGDMKRAGSTAFNSETPRVRAAAPGDFQIKQGFLEMSNVNALQEMVGLMQVMRNFEANQKALSSNDQRLQKAVSELGRVR